ncbi:hypothetical protein PR048_022428 [Dryococelus australis]|uniref:J domain-containing protein n=1 Tax=Dryococelus australis TaxID=614101 RepID=A0ABQ9H0Y4_9NEOP|nr:hypothetical protein PR048_022428 [Dryococelus australis]
MIFAPLISGIPGQALLGWRHVVMMTYKEGEGSLKISRAAQPRGAHSCRPTGPPSGREAWRSSNASPSMRGRTPLAPYRAGRGSLDSPGTATCQDLARAPRLHSLPCFMLISLHAANYRLRKIDITMFKIFVKGEKKKRSIGPRRVKERRAIAEGAGGVMGVWPTASGAGHGNFAPPCVISVIIVITAATISERKRGCSGVGIARLLWERGNFPLRGETNQTQGSFLQSRAATSKKQPFFVCILWLGIYFSDSSPAQSYEDTHLHRRQPEKLDGETLTFAQDLFMICANSGQYLSRVMPESTITVFHSPLTKANRVQSSAGSQDFCKWESRRTMPLVGGFSRGSPVSPAPSFRPRAILISITLIGSQDLDAKSRPNLFTLSLTHSFRWDFIITNTILRLNQTTTNLAAFAFTSLRDVRSSSASHSNASYRLQKPIKEFVLITRRLQIVLGDPTRSAGASQGSSSVSTEVEEFNTIHVSFSRQRRLVLFGRGWRLEPDHAFGEPSRVSAHRGNKEESGISCDRVKSGKCQGIFTWVRRENLYNLLLLKKVLYTLEPASFLRWLLYNCEATPFLTELHVIGAHSCEAFIYRPRITQGVSNKVWSNDRHVAKAHVFGIRTQSLTHPRSVTHQPTAATGGRPEGPPQPGQAFKFTVGESCDRIKEEFNFLQAQYHKPSCHLLSYKEACNEMLKENELQWICDECREPAFVARATFSTLACDWLMARRDVSLCRGYRSTLSRLTRTRCQDPPNALHASSAPGISCLLFSINKMMGHRMNSHGYTHDDENSARSGVCLLGACVSVALISQCLRALKSAHLTVNNLWDYSGRVQNGQLARSALAANEAVRSQSKP